MRFPTSSSTVAAFIMAASIVLPAVATAKNLIKDGGFEKPASPSGYYNIYSPGQKIGPWTVIGNGDVITVSTTFQLDGSTFDAKAGKAYLDLTGDCDCGATSGVAETVKTVSGASYTLSFWVGNTYLSCCGTTSTVNVYIGNTLLTTATNSAGMGINKQVWKKFSKSFVATGKKTVISFVNADPNGDLDNGIDQVNLVQN